MSIYSHLSWAKSGASLTDYNVQSRKNGISTTVKLMVTDTFELGSIIDSLRLIQKDQEETARHAASAARAAATLAKKQAAVAKATKPQLAHTAPLMLTYRGDE